MAKPSKRYEVTNLSWTDSGELARRVAWVLTMAAADIENGVARAAANAVCRLPESDPLRVCEVIPMTAAGIAAGLIRETARRVLKRGLGTKVRACTMTVETKGAKA